MLSDARLLMANQKNEKSNWVVLRPVTTLVPYIFKYRYASSPRFVFLNMFLPPSARFVLASMDLPAELPPDEPGAICNQLHRGGGGQLNEQAQSILASLARTFQPKVAEVSIILGYSPQMRLSGLLARISGIDRTVVSKHLSEHLLGDQAYIKQVANVGGRPGKKRKHLALPEELPDSQSEEIELSMLEPVQEKFPSQLHIAEYSVDRGSSSQASPGEVAGYGLQFSLKPGS